MRVILDTNVLLSGLLTSGGPSERLLDAWEKRQFTLVGCDALVEEVRDVAGRAFFKERLRSSAAELLIAAISDASLFCRELQMGPIAPDPKDSFLLALAEWSEAEFLVTGDKELQALGHHKLTRIVNPATMVGILAD